MKKNLILEQGLINSIISGQVENNIIELIKPEYFQDKQNKLICKSMIKAYNDGCSAGDILNIVFMDESVDFEYLTQLSNMVNYSSSGYEYLSKLKGEYDRVKMINIMKAGILDLQSGNDISSVVESVTNAEYGSKRLQNIAASDVCMSVIDKYEKILSGECVGYYCGIESIDEHFKGFDAGLYNISGRPSMGKTTFSTFFAYSFAKQGYRVWYNTLEDSKELLVAALACSLLNRNFEDYKAGYIPSDDWTMALAEIANSQLTFNELRFGIPELQADLNTRKKEVDIVFIDQLSHIDSTGNTIREQFTKAVQGLQKIQKTTKLLLFYTAQVGRKSEDRADKRPSLSDLKEAGAIEEASDVVMFPFRPAYYDETADKRLLEVIVAKDKLTKKTGKCLLMKSKGGFKSLSKKNGGFND